MSILDQLLNAPWTASRDTFLFGDIQDNKGQRLFINVADEHIRNNQPAIMTLGNLAAAAPEMYKALMLAHGVVNQWHEWASEICAKNNGGTLEERQYETEILHVLEKIVAALSAAEGKAPSPTAGA